MPSDLDKSSSGRDLLLEDLPADVIQSIEARDEWRRTAADAGPGLEFLVSDLDRWRPSSVVRVAFLSGSDELHHAIAEVACEIADACSLELDFGQDSGTFNRWSTADTDYQADIRVSFDMSGYWSLVGTASVDEAIGAPGGSTGGRPHQRSLNLGGYEDRLPAKWERTVLHEFLHALAFQHEHQNMRGPCQDEFRWEDDPGYEATTVQGQFVPDSEGRRPGIYTFLSGPPNNWDRGKIDHNLRSAGREHAVASSFDPASVMLYRFPALFYKSDPSPCAPQGDGTGLSDGDLRGLDLLYPAGATELSAFEDQALVTLERLDELDRMEGASIDAADPVFMESARGVLNHLTYGSVREEEQGL